MEVPEFMTNLGKGDTIIVSEAARFGRLLVEVMERMKYYLERGVTIYIVRDQCFFDDTVDRAAMSFAFGLAARIDSSLTSITTTEALVQKKADGVTLGRRVGSTVKDKLLLKSRKQIKQMLQDGASVSEICRTIGISRNTWYTYKDLIAQFIQR